MGVVRFTSADKEKINFQKPKLVPIPVPGTRRPPEESDSISSPFPSDAFCHEYKRLICKQSADYLLFYFLLFCCRWFFPGDFFSRIFEVKKWAVEFRAKKIRKSFNETYLVTIKVNASFCSHYYFIRNSYAIIVNKIITLTSQKQTVPSMIPVISFSYLFRKRC